MHTATKIIALIASLAIVSTESTLAGRTKQTARKDRPHTPLRLRDLKAAMKALPKIGISPSMLITLDISIQLEACRHFCYYLADPEMTLGQAAEESFALFQQNNPCKFESAIEPVFYWLGTNLDCRKKYKDTAKLKDFAPKDYMPQFTLYITRKNSRSIRGSML
jgi:hypothetical protein